tara:strand:- start:1346 stop:1588 length:243 start_codon:yes stop_codon:yes gene_type:complete
MKPKEKAKELVFDKSKELVCKFYPIVQWELGKENCLDRAKQCALITIDEILKEKEECSKYECYGKELKYWLEVKQEIENL